MWDMLYCKYRLGVLKMMQKIMILNVIKTKDNLCEIRYCMKTHGDSKLMKGMVIMEELEMDEEIFKLSNKIIGKWIKVKIEYITLKNNKVEQKISKQSLYKYVL
jgi:hypothetical protein